MKRVIQVCVCALLFVLMAVSTSSCSLSAKQYLLDNSNVFFDAGVQCVAGEAPEIGDSEYTLLFGWTFVKNADGTWSEKSIPYVDAGMKCGAGENAALYLTTCNVTKEPDESPCSNITKWKKVDDK